MTSARILVIDDKAEVLQTVGRMLTTAGYVVVEAGDGKTGIEMMTKDPCDLVITDMFMPLQDGIETIGLIKKLDPRIPVIAMSGGKGRGPYSPLEDAKSLGADITLDKPFTMEALVGAVKELTSRRQPA